MTSSRKHDEANGYDLSSTGTIVELTCRDGPRVGWNIEAGSAVDLVVEVKGNGSNWLQHDSGSSVTTFNGGATLPEARYVRIRNTSTVADTANALLGVSE